MYVHDRRGEGKESHASSGTVRGHLESLAPVSTSPAGPFGIILDRTSSIILSGSVESEHPCLVPDIRGEVFNLSPLSMMLWDCHTSPLLRCVLSIPNLLRVFIMMNVEFCQMLFLYIQMIIDSFLSFSNVMYDIH